MTTVVPPPPAPPPTSSVPGSLPAAVVAAPPPALARFPVGGLIEGKVVAEQSKGMFKVNIAKGSFVMQASLPLPKNALLVLQLVSLGPKAHLQIISINGKPSPLALRQLQTFGTAKSPVAGKALTSSLAGGKALPTKASPFVTLRPGATLAATLLKSPPGWGSSVTTGATGTKPKLDVASQTAVKGVTRTIIGAKTITPGVGKAGSSVLAGKGTSKTLPPLAISRSISNKSGIFPVGSQMKVKVLSLNLVGGQPAKVTAMPSTPLRVPALASLSVGNTLTGTVTGKTSLGQPILKTSVGAMTLATRTPAPVGSTMTLEITSELTAPRHYSAANTSREIMLQSRTWPSLEEAVKALEELSPAIAQQVTNTVIAQPNARLATNMIFFMSALVGGNMSSWIGDGAMRTLQRFRPELADKLKGDFKSLENMAKEPTRGDWRVSLIPIYAGEGIEQIRVMTRKLGDDENDEDEEAEGTRFVVDVDLSHLGRMQLDGLVQDKGKRLDLIVRSNSVLSADMRDDIRGIFRQAGDVANIKGGVTFQAGPADFVELSPREPDRLGLIV